MYKKALRMFIIFLVVTLLVTAVSPVVAETPGEEEPVTPNAEGTITIKHLAAGSEGDVFQAVVARGAQDAADMFGVEYETIYGDAYSCDVYMQQMREAIAAQPDAIMFMPYCGVEASEPLVKEAVEAGIIVTFLVVDAPDLRLKYNAGYAGPDLYNWGFNYGLKAAQTFGLVEGDKAIVFGAWGYEHAIREQGVADGLEGLGVIIDKVSAVEGSSENPELLTPVITGAFLRNPDTKIIVFAGSQQLGHADMYMEAVDKAPGDVAIIGFDMSPEVVEMFRSGWVQMTADQQPYLEGFIPVMNIAQRIMYGFAPLVVDTGGGLIDESNWELVAELATDGIR